MVSTRSSSAQQAAVHSGSLQVACSPPSASRWLCASATVPPKSASRDSRSMAACRAVSSPRSVTLPVLQVRQPARVGAEPFRLLGPGLHGGEHGGVLLPRPPGRPAPARRAGRPAHPASPAGRRSPPRAVRPPGRPSRRSPGPGPRRAAGGRDRPPPRRRRAAGRPRRPGYGPCRCGPRARSAGRRNRRPPRPARPHRPPGRRPPGQPAGPGWPGTRPAGTGRRRCRAGPPSLESAGVAGAGGRRWGR